MITAPETCDFINEVVCKAANVKELFEYMDLTISSDLNFVKVDKNDFNYSGSFNPNKVQTNREKYVFESELKIFENIYIKT